eukprot:CAMPEP_0115623954 /NCGR_PEP_ID=MMETSP0272-20121206/27043_1 /TAXON_ID=71861 /ORGANISM="Scrippsiella trochoidea, Strain CCMP3099" /LENGTH=294 /DNA_ID=CAMNT_0003060191 /DNA_START=27 /DNA_END=908 /DNA_ORIENTATION=-
MSRATSQFRRDMAGDAAGLMLHPQAPQLVRNHAKDNIRAMREKERQLRGQRILQASQRPAEPFKMKQFSEAKSRVFDSKSSQPQLPRLQHLQQQQQQQEDRAGRPPSATAAEVGSDCGGEGGEIGLAEFEEQVANLIRKHGTKKQTTFVKGEDNIPAYIKARKETMAEQRRAEEAERLKPKLPAGYRQLPAEEVAETLQALQKKRQELETEFRKLPLKIETDSQKRRQKVVLDKIEESDRAIAMFSQPTVLVQAYRTCFAAQRWKPRLEGSRRVRRDLVGVVIANGALASRTTT